MGNQNNNRLQQIVEAWARLPEVARVAIHTLATSLLDLQGYEIAGRMVNLLTCESPETNACTPNG